METRRRTDWFEIRLCVVAIEAHAKEVFEPVMIWVSLKHCNGVSSNSNVSRWTHSFHSQCIVFVCVCCLLIVFEMSNSFYFLFHLKNVLFSYVFKTIELLWHKVIKWILLVGKQFFGECWLSNVLRHLSSCRVCVKATLSTVFS